jgi:hypothetical protein
VNEVKARGPSAAVKKVTGNEELVESLQDLMVFPPPSTSTSERCKQGTDRKNRQLVSGIFYMHVFMYTLEGSYIVRSFLMHGIDVLSFCHCSFPVN